MPKNKTSAEKYKSVFGEYPAWFTPEPKPTEQRRQEEAELKGRVDRGETLSPADSSAVAPYINSRARQQQQEKENKRKEQEKETRSRIYNQQPISPSDSLGYSSDIKKVLEFQDYMKERATPEKPEEEESGRTTTQAILEFAKKKKDIGGLKESMIPEESMSSMITDEGVNPVEEIKKNPDYKALVRLDNAYSDSTRFAENMSNFGITDFDSGVSLVKEFEQAKREYDRIRTYVSKEAADNWLKTNMNTTIGEIRETINAIKQ